MSTHIRPVQQADLPALKAVLDSIELFPSDMLEDMIADYFQNESSTDIWFTATQEEKPIAIAYCAPERMTEGTWNLYAIGVLQNQQGKGVGRKMMRYIEDQLRQKGQRVLIMETSALPNFALTREFYDKCAYHQEAVIRDFYQEGEGKVVFWKKLTEKG